jgi:hypothetical protein
MRVPFHLNGADEDRHPTFRHWRLSSQRRLSRNPLGVLSKSPGRKSRSNDPLQQPRSYPPVEV